MPAPTILPGRAFQGTDRVSDLLFSWRSSRLSLTADTGQVGTFARASAGGLVQGTGLPKDLDPDNQLRLVGPAPDQLERWEWVQNASGVYVPALRLEGARTNGWARSEELNDGLWTKNNCTIAVNGATSPDGAVTMDKIVEDSDVGQIHRVTRQPPAMSDDTTQALSFFIQADERSEVLVRTQTKGAVDRDSFFNAGTGTWGTTNVGHTVTVESVGATTYRISVAWDSGNGGGNGNVEIQLSSGSETVAYNGDGASGLYLWGIQFEVDQPFASTYIPTVGSTVTRAAESLFWTFNAVPQPMTVYGRIENWKNAQASLTAFHIGSATAAGDARIQLDITAAGALQARYDNGSIDATTGAITAPTEGVGVEYIVTLTAAGVVGLSVSADGGAPTTTTTGAGGALPASWAGTRFYANSAGSTLQGFGAHASHKVAPGVRSMSYMRGAW